MRFFSIIATGLLAITPAVMAQQNPQNCLDKCHVYSRSANCPASHPVGVYPCEPGMFD